MGVDNSPSKYYNSWKPTATAAPTANKNQDEESDRGGRGGGGGGLLDQVIQGPQWGNNNPEGMGLSPNWNQRINRPVNGINQPLGGMGGGGGSENENGFISYRGQGGQESPTPVYAYSKYPNQVLAGTNITGGEYLKSIGIEPYSPLVPAAQRAAGTEGSLSYGYHGGNTWDGPTSIKDLVNGNPPEQPALPRAGVSEAPSQTPSWLQTMGGSPFQPGDMPLWRPSDWVNPSNPNPPETVAAPAVDLGLNGGIGAGNPTGLLASLLSNEPQQPVMPSAIDYYAEQQKQKVAPGYNTYDQPMGYGANSFVGGNGMVNGQGRFAWVDPNSVAQRTYPGINGANSFVGGNGIIQGQGPYPSVNPETVFNPQQPAGGYANQVIAPSTQQGLTPGQSQNLQGTTVPGAGGLLNQTINQPSYNPNAPSNGGVVTGQSTPDAVTPAASTPTTPGAGKDATGKTINPWEQVQDPGSGVVHPRGLSLEEVTNSGASNLTKGFDYRNNPGFKGQTVTMPDGTVLPQIAGYYITNGRYFPIDLTAVGNLFKRYSSGGGGGGGGYRSSGGGGAKGWLASWNIGV